MKPSLSEIYFETCLKQNCFFWKNIRGRKKRYSLTSSYASSWEHKSTCLSCKCFRFMHGDGATTTCSSHISIFNKPFRRSAKFAGEWVAFVTNIYGILFSLNNWKKTQNQSKKSGWNGGLLVNQNRNILWNLKCFVGRIIWNTVVPHDTIQINQATYFLHSA